MDADSPAEKITFSVSKYSSDSCGFVALSPRNGARADVFTQADLEAGRVVFKHQGGHKCALDLTLSDGLNSAGAQVAFRIRVREVQLHHVGGRQVRTENCLKINCRGLTC